MNCLFCKIIEGEIPSYKIFEDDMVIAFLDINPASPGHTLIVPKKHEADFTTLNSEILNHLQLVAEKLTKELMTKLKTTGCSLVINYGSTQDIKHFHLHLIPKGHQVYQKASIEEILAQLKK